MSLETFLRKPEPLLAVFHQLASHISQGFVILAGFVTGSGSVIRAEPVRMGSATEYIVCKFRVSRRIRNGS